MDYFIVIFLVIFSALFSGLTLGFFSLNKEDLERKAQLGDKKAKKVYKIRKNGNLLLCTLLIGNVAVNTTLSIFLGNIATGLVGGLIATSLIVVFGEITPQAFFSRYALEFCSKLVPLVRLFILILYPVCYPISWMLDKLLGDEVPNIYSRRELMKIIEEHEGSEHSDIDVDEEKIIKGALSYSNKIVQNILTPRTEIFALQGDEKLNKDIIKKIVEVGHSRIPVYKNKLDEIIGVLYVKDLIGKDFSGKKIETIARKDVIFVDYNKQLDDLLNAFKKTKHHLFIVMGEYGEVSGIVTIEDVIEEIIGSEIVDEFDQYEDLQAVAKEKKNKREINKV